jgi:hypothetical protein
VRVKKEFGADRRSHRIRIHDDALRRVSQMQLVPEKPVYRTSGLKKRAGSRFTWLAATLWWAALNTDGGEHKFASTPFLTRVQIPTKNFFWWLTAG